MRCTDVGFLVSGFFAIGCTDVVWCTGVVLSDVRVSIPFCGSHQPPHCGVQKEITLCYYFLSRKLHLQLEFGGGSVTILTTLNQNIERTETGKVIKSPATKNTANKAKVSNKAGEIPNNAIVYLAIRFSDLLDSFNVKALHD